VDTNEVVRYLPVLIQADEKRSLETEVAEIDVAEFRQELTKDTATDEIKTLKEKRRIIAAKLSNGSETKEVACYWVFIPEHEFKKGDIKLGLYPTSDSGAISTIPEHPELWEDDGKGSKDLVRKDTGDIVEQEPMEAEDFQESLPLETDKKSSKKTKNGTTDYEKGVLDGRAGHE